MGVCTVARRQTMLFSATQTRKVEDLARISLKKEPLYVGVDDDKANATVDGLEQVLGVISPGLRGSCWILVVAGVIIQKADESVTLAFKWTRGLGCFRKKMHEL